MTRLFRLIFFYFFLLTSVTRSRSHSCTNLRILFFILCLSRAFLSCLLSVSLPQRFWEYVLQSSATGVDIVCFLQKSDMGVVCDSTFKMYLAKSLLLYVENGVVHRGRRCRGRVDPRSLPCVNEALPRIERTSKHFPRIKITSGFCVNLNLSVVVVAAINCTGIEKT